MFLEVALFATLPLALLSFFSRGRGAHAGLGFLAALAPVVASAVGGIFKRKGAQNEQNREIDYRRQQAEQQEAQNRARFEAFQGSPQAQMQRLGMNTRLSRLLGAFGGREQTPGFIQSAFDAARSPQEYTPGSEFIEPPTRGGSFWDYASDIVGPGGAASYFDTERFKNRGQGGGVDLTSQGTTAPAAPAAGASGFRPSTFRQMFQVGQTPAADEFLRERRG